jgi:poly-gamma-glutamate capsule biosynthesis protein CapA/YwtB (metallophosphatase superfamily)
MTALAAVTAALAVAIPAATASAAPAGPAVDPQVCSLLTTSPLASQVPGAASLATVLSQAGSTVGCSAAAAPAGRGSLFPAFPWWHH